MHKETERDKERLIYLRHIYDKKEIGLSMHLQLLPEILKKITDITI